VLKRTREQIEREERDEGSATIEREMPEDAEEDLPETPEPLVEVAMSDED
jgi:hypothetical protein